MIKDPDSVKPRYNARNFGRGIEDTLEDIGRGSGFDSGKIKPTESSIARTGKEGQNTGYSQQLALAEKILMAQYVELRMAYEILSTTEKKYRNLYEHSPDLLRSISDDGIILDCNENYAKSLGYTKEEVTGCSITVHTAERSMDDLMRGLEDWKKNGSVKNQTIWLRRKDGSEFPALLSGTNLFDERGAIVGRVVSLRDMTEILNARESLKEEKAKRLMTIGQVSARLTHDIRNPLMAISNAAELLRMRLGNGDPKVFSLIDAIGRSVKRITYQLDDVLNYVRNTETEKSLCSMRGIISSCIKKSAVPENVKVVLPEDDLEVFCDGVKIEVVIENMVRNSIQAIGGSPGEIKIAFDSKAACDTVTVSDSGPGIPDAILPKIFEPLFTTKRDGTGLGLTTCKNLLEQHGWTIEVIPPSTFSINIPRK